MKTVWSHGVLRDVPPRFAPLAKFAYPLSYALFVLVFGIYGAIQGGSASVAAVSLPWYPHVLCALVGASALLCLIGVVFLKQTVELVGGALLVAFTTMYLILLFIALGTTNGAPIAATTTTGVVIILIGIRGYDLLNEIGKRKMARDER